MMYVVALIVFVFALLLGVMGGWQWRNGFRLSGGLSLVVAVGLIVFGVWYLTT